MSEISKNKMGTENIQKLMFKMAMPAIFSMIIQALYNIIDSIYVSNYSDAAFTAVSLAYPMQMILISVAVGTGIGINSLIARRLGEGKPEDANDAAVNGIFLAVISGLVFILIAVFTTKPFYALFKSSAETYEMACDYSFIVVGFSMFMLIQIFIEKIFQSTGNMILPMTFNLVGAITNIILDPIFIFGYFGLPSMGVVGAALATIIGQFFGMSLAIFFLLKKSTVLTISFKGFRPNFIAIKNIYRVGFPSIVMQSIVSVMTSGLNIILANFSEAAVSVLGIYFKLQSFIFMPVFGISQGALPIIGFNYGAKNKKRMTATIKTSIVSALAIMFAGVLLFNLFPAQLISMFAPTDEVMEIGIPALRVISFSFFGSAVGIMLSNTFQATGYGIMSLIASFIRQLILILPIAYVLSRYFGLMGVWASFTISEVIAVCIIALLYRRIYKKDYKHLELKKVIE